MVSGISDSLDSSSATGVEDLPGSGNFESIWAVANYNVLQGVQLQGTFAMLETYLQ